MTAEPAFDPTAQLEGPADPWDYDGTFDVTPGLRLVSTPGHTPGHQALLVAFTDGRSFVCAGDAAYTLQAIIDHTPTGRGTDPEQSVASLHTLTSLGAEILTALGLAVGVMLVITVNALSNDRLQVSIIDYTLKHTALGDLQPGSRVHVETDLIGKYVLRLIEPYTRARGEVAATKES